jgi:hypothetical protein
MMKPMEQVGSIPQPGVNPQAAMSPKAPQDPRQEFNLTDDDLDYFRHDPEIIAAVQKFTGRDFPMDQIDDALIVQIAGAVHKLGVDGAVAEFDRVLPQDIKAQIRGVAMKQRVPRVGGR